MARLLLTICFALTTLPGPGLCCCALRFRPQQSAPAKPRCPHCKAEQPPAKPEPRPTPSTCGCKHELDQATLTPAPQPLVPMAASLDTPSCSAVTLDPSDAGPAPSFLEPGRLLRVFHRLRC